MPIDAHPYANLFPFLTEDLADDLARDIKRNGLLDPIVLFEGKILDGRNRSIACEKVGVEPHYFEFTGTDAEALAYALSKNMHRRHLTESQRAMISAKVYLSASSKNKKMTQEKAAQDFKVSDRSVRHATRVLTAGDKDLIGRVDSGAIPVSIASKIAALPEANRKLVLADPAPEKAIKKVARRLKEEALADQIANLPNSQFGVILADPPWQFKTYSQDGMDRSADNHYPTQTTDAICQLDVSSIAAADSVLFLWATAPMLIDAIEVMATWGFDYKTHFIWVKDRQGTGYWNRNQHELLLVGTKGSVPAPAPGTQWPSIIDATVGRHSEKPDVFYDLIEEYYPYLPRIELNARGPSRPTWAVWGLEAMEEEYV